MKPIGTLNLQKQEKEDTNGADWSPGYPETGERGHQ